MTRDLLWLLASPPLLSNSLCTLVNETMTQALADEVRAKIDAGVWDESRLIETVAKTPRSYKLGIYCEALLTHCLKNTLHLKKVWTHLSVFENQRSVGEFDFLVQHLEMEHWEMAVKFYCLDDRILDGQNAYPDNFLGPEGRDTLGMKLKKLLNRQVSLAKTPAGSLALKNLGIDAEKVQARILSRGCFYYHWSLVRKSRANGTSTKASIVADFLHPQSAEGIWIRSSEISSLMPEIIPDSNTRFAIRERLGWITPPEKPDSMLHVKLWVDSVDALNDYFLEKAESALSEGVLVDICVDQLCKERVFILNPHWPTPKTY